MDYNLTKKKQAIADTEQRLPKRRLVQLTEGHATLRVCFESAKLVAAESTQKATKAEMDNVSMVRELDEVVKKRIVRALEQEVLEMQKK